MRPNAARLVRRPSIKPEYRVAVAPREGVVLLSPGGDTLLEGALYERVVPLLDGRLSPEAIVDALGADVDRTEVYYALQRLQSRGFITDASRQRRNGHKTKRHPVRERGPEVELVLIDVDKARATRALRAAGWQIRAGAAECVVLADDLLSPGLQAIARDFAKMRRRWLLAVPIAPAPSVGPMFGRGLTACYECLAQRVGRNRAIESYLLARHRAPRRLARTPDDEVMWRRTLSQARRILALAAHDPAHHSLWTWEAATRTWVQHVVARRPQCPACGDAALYHGIARRPWNNDGVALGNAPITSRSDLVDPVTGVVTALLPHPVPALPALHICVAATGSTRGRQRLHDVLRDLRHQPSGRGTTAKEAATGALGEAVERYCGVWQGDEPRIRATFDSLGTAAIHPDRVLNFSRQQQHDRLRLNRRAAPSARVPARLDASVPISWTPVWSITRAEERWLPSSLLYYGHPEARAPGFCYADSNGCAAGATREAAIGSGLLELMERDAVAMWWYNRVRRPAVDIESAGDPWCAAMVVAFRKMGREIWALDLTNDLQVPTIAALSRRLTASSEALLMGFGAHPSPRTALRRALAEMGQMYAATATFEQNDSIIEPDVDAWLTRANVREHGYLLPRGRSRPSAREEVAVDATKLIDVLHARGFEVLVLDQTRPDVGVPVVRVIVPGLRHFWPRLGPGRLYDVPVSLRWLSFARVEAELNPTPFFL